MRTLTITARAGVLAATAGALLFTGVAAQGTAVAAPQGKPAKLTVAAYRDYLKHKDVKTLKAFDKLPKAKQQKFVVHLQSAAVTKAFNVKVGGVLGKNGHAEVVYNNDIRFVGDTRSTVVDDSHGIHRVTVNFTATERIYGIPVVTQKTTLSYVFDDFRPKPQVVGKPSVRSTVTNLNAAFGINAPKSTVTVKNRTTVVGAVAWKATPKYKSAGSAAITKRQSITSTHGATDKFTAVLAKS
ncbi:hypothetical protein PV416_40030 [Streptomyces ipomoeae]|jgi:hypothetical protein|uniref:Tat pathway signal sequence domain protein n=1 Tax=Streptomyces ipomoeae 91-03 TaxID=698759 RepID=L1KJ77_9ACTN|nr:hypothetical protein [Streptomyces ipomoeae]EKX60438.1 hypothetical protein STRIP9103_05768 [Streptomyces ipomoeae 91-03]MDX2698033.1 hypothetical protein [Streptomyces ipomoeae]MDX2827089.1 hypothetical protein [Streptomyces ipomoeae]MDX2843026.1 hypothetical protein [Streptomyces ipomoeae]MDX2879697.1 hypothetical protein [Streptomyces ipomoeae]